MATGLGNVEARASAVGGDSSGGFVGPAGAAGSGLAHASAEGATGFARALASTGVGAGPQLRVLSDALVGSRSDVVAQATFGAALSDAPADPDLAGMAFATGDPVFEDVGAALGGNDALAELFALDSRAEMLALSRWQGGGRSTEDEPLVLSTEVGIVLAETDPERSLVLAAFDVSALGDFEELVFVLEKKDSPQSESVTFETLEAATAFFEDRVFDLGTGFAEGDAVLARFELSTDGDGVFGMRLGFAMVVPEPATGLLLALGLVVIGLRRRRTSTDVGGGG